MSPPFPLLSGSRHAHHPRHAEFVCTHAKQRRPEGRRDRHLHAATLAECLIDSPDFCFVLSLHANLETAERRRLVRRRITAHQQSVAYRNRGVHDFAAPIRRRWRTRRSIAVCDLEEIGRFEYLRVEGEGFSAISLEIQMHAHSHGGLISLLIFWLLISSLLPTLRMARVSDITRGVYAARAMIETCVPHSVTICCACARLDALQHWPFSSYGPLLPR